MRILTLDVVESPAGMDLVPIELSPFTTVNSGGFPRTPRLIVSNGPTRTNRATVIILRN
jgi:hypothetical protein